MKLSVKIFLSICISALVSSLLVLGIILNKNYEVNIQNENERSVEEFHIIKNNIEENLNKNSNITIEEVLEIYNDYYSNNDITFMYTYFNEVVESFAPELNKYVSADLLTTSGDTYLSKIVEADNKYYLFIATSLEDDNQRIIYIREITEIYENQNEIKQYGYAIIIATIIAVAMLSFTISKSLTIPLVNMAKVTRKISKGNYEIKLKENNSEFGKLAKAFNKMTTDIKTRNDELVGLVQNKQTFIDNLSHEMNTPLTTIQGYAEFLERANVSEEERIKYLQYIRQESKRIRDIYKKLLLLSYKRESDLEIKKEKFESLIEEVRISVNERLKEKNIELVIDNDINILKCDKTLVQVAISNLIINAMHVSKEGSKILVECYNTKNNEKIIEVTDFGIGISKENIEKILEPFYRVDKVRSREQGGAGLGLSICKSIMQMHNGKIQIQSEIGKGSKFILIFP